MVAFRMLNHSIKREIENAAYMAKKVQKDGKTQSNRIAIRLTSPESIEMRDRFNDCARRLKRTIEREMKFVSTVGEASPRQVGEVANLADVDDVIWVRAVSNEDVLPCKSLIQLAAEQSKLDDNVLVYVNPGPMMSYT